MQKHAGINYLLFMRRMHEVLAPKSYVEIGTATGQSLALANCDAVAIDPKFRIEAGWSTKRTRTFFFQQESDDFFRDEDLFDYFPGGVDMAFLDGMHLFEFLLRDFLNIARYLRRNSVVILHDCLPLTEDMAEREQGISGQPFPGWWTGDVWKIVPAIKKHFPDVRMSCLDCPPTGLVVLTNIDQGTQSAPYFDIVDEFMPAEPGWLPAYYESLDILDSKALMDPNEMRKRYWL